MRFRPLLLLFGTLLVLALSHIFLSQNPIAYGQSDSTKAMRVTALNRVFPYTESCLFVSDWQPPHYGNGNLVIRDEQTLRDRVGLNSSEDCSKRGYPNIDWSQYTLIGTKVRILGGCSSPSYPSTFAVRVVRDDARELYQHTTIVNPGPCAGDSHSQSWVLVPQLPVGYNVEFEETQDPSMVMYCNDIWDD